jgi:hypothetical protein
MLLPDLVRAFEIGFRVVFGIGEYLAISLPHARLDETALHEHLFVDAACTTRGGALYDRALP